MDQRVVVILIDLILFFHVVSSVYVNADEPLLYLIYCSCVHCIHIVIVLNKIELEMWANAQRDGRPAEHRWRPLFNAVKFG